ncbi:GntR family transcriptional regulator [soil metagenome]
MTTSEVGGLRLGNPKTLPTQMADDLRSRLARREWRQGDQLPTEADLVNEYGVSRASVRQALKTLENQGLIVTKRGRGSFVADDAMIRAGMQELTSITSTIAEMGHVPGMIYHHRIVRPAKASEREMFDLAPSDEVLDIQRKILADDITVAYSYDVLPRWAFPDNFEPDQLTGSVFAYLAAHNGPTPLRALARVHAVAHPQVAWDEDFTDDQLFVLLDQLHFDQQSRPFMHTTSYFIEGRFNFTVVRTSPSH